VAESRTSARARRLREAGICSQCGVVETPKWYCPDCAEKDAANRARKRGGWVNGPGKRGRPKKLRNTENNS
jgi:hypothetical protein